jgi:DNA-binding MarR family transcriptional regulator
MLKEKTIDQLIRELWMSITKLYNEEAAKYNGTMAIGYVLLKVDPQVGTPSTALALMLGMETTSLSRTLKKMEDKGLIYRERNPYDGRSVLIKLTDYGSEMREKSKQTVLQFNEAIKNNISQKDIDAFMKVSNIMLNLINQKEIYNNK